MTRAVYMPILRGLQGENWALRDQGFRPEIYPVVQIPRIKWDDERDEPKFPVKKHVENLLGRTGLRSALESVGTCALDGLLLESYDPSDSAEALSRLSEFSSRHGVSVVPATGLDRSPDYNDTVRTSSSRHGGGVLLRVTREDLYTQEELKTAVEALLEELKLGPHEADLCCDLGVVSEQDEEADLQLLLGSLPSFPHLDRWRSFWFAGGSFPENLREVDRESIAYLPRVEWTLWTELGRLLHSSRMPQFGDYGVYHPISPVPSIAPNMSTNIRYTTEDHWMVVKGLSVRSAGYDDYHERCAILVSSGEFSGRGFSPGDRYFDDCASGDDGPGNAAKWRCADTSHHMAFVSEHILKLQRRR